MVTDALQIRKAEIQVKKAEKTCREFELFVQAERPKLLKIAAGMLGSLDEAEDAVQDSLIKMFQKWDSADNKPAYLYRILSHTCIDRLRARPKQQDIPPLYNSEETKSSTSARLAVRSALEMLKPEERAALLLREVEQLCYREIADVLGATVMQVTNWIYRGKTALREQLKPHFGRKDKT